MLPRFLMGGDGAWQGREKSALISVIRVEKAFPALFIQLLVQFRQQTQSAFAVFGDGGGALLFFLVLGARGGEQGFMRGHAAQGGLEHAFSLFVGEIFRHGAYKSGWWDAFKRFPAASKAGRVFLPCS